jgi:hypothetical protein
MGLVLAQKRFIFVFVPQMLCLQQQKIDISTPRKKITCGRIGEKFDLKNYSRFVTKLDLLNRLASIAFLYHKNGFSRNE